MTNYIAIHDNDYKTDFPLTDIEAVLLSLNFTKTIEDDHLAESRALFKEENGRFDHEKCGTILAFANKNGGYGHYGLPQNVNLIELIVWHENNYNECEVLARKIAELLNWQVFIDDLS